MLFILIIRLCFCLLPASPCWGWRTPKVQAAAVDTLLVEVEAAQEEEAPDVNIATGLFFPKCLFSAQ